MAYFIGVIPIKACGRCRCEPAGRLIGMCDAAASAIDCALYVAPGPLRSVPDHHVTIRPPGASSRMKYQRVCHPGASRGTRLSVSAASG